MTRVVIPGSFDPVTLGHKDIFITAANTFTQVDIIVTVNPNKPGWLPLDIREQIIRTVMTEYSNVIVANWSGLLVDYVRNNNIKAIVKGIRDEKDYTYEAAMAGMNKHLSQVPTYFVNSDSKYRFIASSLVREVYKLKGDISGLVPAATLEALHNWNK